jgi:hypothetical protein
MVHKIDFTKRDRPFVPGDPNSRRPDMVIMKSKLLIGLKICTLGETNDMCRNTESIEKERRNNISTSRMPLRRRVAILSTTSELTQHNFILLTWTNNLYMLQSSMRFWRINLCQRTAMLRSRCTLWIIQLTIISHTCESGLFDATRWWLHASNVGRWLG